MTIQNNTVIVVKGEAHYLWPIDDYNGYTPKCSECEYYEALPEKKTTYDGECTSVAMNTDRTYLHRSSGNDFVTASNCGCKWWYVRNAERIEQQVIGGEDNGGT